MNDQDILNELSTLTFPGDLKNVLEYALTPSGKLFRPNLVSAICRDLKVSSFSNITHLGLALEFHHVYSLIHDDLPAMDNDLIRRGKASVHAHYGEWKAILSGDGLLILSFETLEKIKLESQSNKNLLRKFFYWATGPKGLIGGQWLDLSHQGHDFNHLLRIHELKTSRLMQIAFIGSLLLSNQESNLKKFKNFLFLGSSLGLIFQLLDDLDDFKQISKNSLSHHELMINPFEHFSDLSFSTLESLLLKFSKHLNDMPETKNFIKKYLLKNAENLGSQKEELNLKKIILNF